MPKQHRLSGEELRNIAGKRFHGRFFSLLVAKGAGAHAKCAIVVSKKVSPKAVIRNTLKRRGRNALRKPLQAIRKPVHLVLYAKSNAKVATFAELSSDIESLLSRV